MFSEYLKSCALTDQALPNFLQECERAYLEEALTKTLGNKRKAAELSGIALSSFRQRIDRYTVKIEYQLR